MLLQGPEAEAPTRTSDLLGVVRVDGVEEVLKLLLVEDAICEEELEFLQGQLPVICRAEGTAAGVWR